MLASIAGPSRLVRPEDLVKAHDPFVHADAAVWALVVFCFLVSAFLYLSRRRKTDPRQRAFAVLARRAKLTSAQRRDLHKRARLIGSDPVALIVCPRSAKALVEAAHKSRDVAGRIGGTRHTRARAAS